VPADWSRVEVEATVSDYLAMLASELASVPYSKTAHRQRLRESLNNRTEQSVEFKHANISAVLINLGFPYISGYKPRSNYQRLLYEVVADRLINDQNLVTLAAVDAERPIVVPEVDDILSVLTDAPKASIPASSAEESRAPRRVLKVNYLEREAQNRSLGAAGEEFVINFERARLIRAGRDGLAARIEHTSRVRGDGDGFDILSFEESGRERLIEVKTTKYGRETPFFVSRNELVVSEARADLYHLYRLFKFRDAPRIFTLNGALSMTCRLAASTYMANVL
jgi:Domain of unknown function (DUF3883)